MQILLLILHHQLFRRRGFGIRRIHFVPANLWDKPLAVGELFSRRKSLTMYQESQIMTAIKVYAFEIYNLKVEELRSLITKLIYTK